MLISQISHKLYTGIIKRGIMITKQQELTHSIFHFISKPPPEPHQPQGPTKMDPFFK